MCAAMARWCGAEEPLEKAQAPSMRTTVLYNVSQTLVNLALQKPMLEPNCQE